jgi:pseudaminic acid cytidylyltransferase
MERRIAIITARGGSKRIPRKNIRDFFGKPIIAYSIEAAIQSNLFDEVMVSTDDHEIAEIAIKYGAKVPFFRSEKNSNDFATMIDVLIEVLDDYKNKFDQEFEIASCIYPCSPLLQVSDLKQSILNLEDPRVESSFPIVAFTFPILRSLKINNENYVEMNWPEYISTRSQDLPEAYHLAGLFCSFKVASFFQTKDLYFHSKPIILEQIDVQDIDNESDWKMAELKWKMRNEKI